jgi:TolA-binding protein
MVFLCRCFLIFSALVLGGTPVFAASARENRAYAAAVSAFQDAMWSRAETEFAQFVAKYPKSTNATEAVLLQAQAEFKQGKFVETITLLSTRKAEAGKFADQYDYWIGESQFQNGDFSTAAETFVSLAQNFPESPLRLPAVVAAAAARAQLNQWPQVGALLGEPGGLFSRAAQIDSANELVVRGRLLLAQAEFAQKDFNGAAAILQLLAAQPLEMELDWQRAYLLCQVKLAAGDLNAALAVTTNLLQIAPGGNDNRRAESKALRAEALEKLGRTNEAISVYQENLTKNAPEEQQRRAILKIAELSIAQKQFANAESSLQQFLADFSNSPAADVALLTLGELHLKDFAAQPAATNHLQQASALFSRFLGAFTNSPLAGKAYLDRGWCDWFAWKISGGVLDISNSLSDFRLAVEKLQPSEDLAVARFKTGDAMFALTNYAGALTNYRAVLEDFTKFPAVGKMLGDPALYQVLRTCLKLNDMTGANAALAQILKFYPASDLADNSLLLVGESQTDLNHPVAARDLFQDFEKKFPDSGLRPQVEMAIARTYEQEQNWPAAISQYEGWLKLFPTNSLRPQVNYAQAWANFQAGNETNAFVLFTNFVTQFPTNELAPLAQWWVADYFYHAPEPDHYVNAERNYKFIFQNTNWQSSPLIYPAQLMAGRAAVGRLGYLDAIGYFTGLTGDTNCPPDLDAKALFLCGGAYMQMNSPDTNNPLANFQLATNVFAQIVQMYPTNELSALAWGEIGDCDLQLTNFDAATNAYAQAVSSSFAKIGARSQAQIGWGIALEKEAALMTGNDRTNLLQLALNNYLDVLYGKNLRDGEMPDAFWTEKAGLQAAALAETLGEWSQAVNLYQRLEELLPQLKDSLERKIKAVRENFPPPTTNVSFDTRTGQV